MTDLSSWPLGLMMAAFAVTAMIIGWFGMEKTGNACDLAGQLTSQDRGTTHGPGLPTGLRARPHGLESVVLLVLYFGGVLGLAP